MFLPVHKKRYRKSTAQNTKRKGLAYIKNYLFTTMTIYMYIYFITVTVVWWTVLAAISDDR